MHMYTGSYEKTSFVFWNIIDHANGTWSLTDGLGFCDYYYLQHKIFKKWHIIKCEGYKAEYHTEYKKFLNKHLKIK